MTSKTETMCELNLYTDSVTGYYDNEYYDSEYYGMEYYGNQTIMTIDELSIDLDVIYNNRTDLMGTNVMGTDNRITEIIESNVLVTEVSDTDVLSPITETILTQT
jgi:hypothetical protein